MGSSCQCRAWEAVRTARTRQVVGKLGVGSTRRAPAVAAVFQGPWLCIVYLPGRLMAESARRRSAAANSWAGVSLLGHVRDSQTSSKHPAGYMICS